MLEVTALPTVPQPLSKAKLVFLSTDQVSITCQVTFLGSNKQENMLFFVHNNTAESKLVKLEISRVVPRDTLPYHWVLSFVIFTYIFKNEIIVASFCLF